MLTHHALRNMEYAITVWWHIICITLSYLHPIFSYVQLHLRISYFIGIDFHTSRIILSYSFHLLVHRYWQFKFDYSICHKDQCGSRFFSTRMQCAKFLVSVKVTIFWVVTPCSLVEIYPCVSGTYCLSLSIPEESNLHRMHCT
jgi:hypothetical protein